MTPDPNRPEVLLTVSTEIEAGAIVTALAECDIQALSIGGYTSGFKAEAPGSVAVVVKRADFDRAKQALAEIREQQSRIDWSKVDVTETLEAESDAEDIGSAAPAPPIVINHLWWILELLGIAICLVVWLFTRQLTPLLVYAATALALIGVLLALFPFAVRRR
jgi:hypothetical protein